LLRVKPPDPVLAYNNYYVAFSLDSDWILGCCDSRAAAAPVSGVYLREKKERESVPVYTIRKTNAPPPKERKKREKNIFLIS